ncbi:unnamed protein product [Orchesella dallaii]|uniref:Uncharacterized protein n=1 Tax=Orchesella dallaii TaxID=48710 RepID=A0ABP1RYD6_9HEXA
MATSEDFNQQIRKKLLELYGGGKEKKDAEDFVTLLIFLDREVMMEKDQKYVSPFNQTLKLVLEMSNDLVLKEYTDRMLNDAKAIQKDPNVHKEMVKIYNQLTKPNSDQLLDEKFYLASNLDKSICEQSGGLGFLSG